MDDAESLILEDLTEPADILHRFGYNHRKNSPETNQTGRLFMCWLNAETHFFVLTSNVVDEISYIRTASLIVQVTHSHNPFFFSLRKINFNYSLYQQNISTILCINKI